jgi:dihydrolipoamide dehydrogenase
LKLPGPAEIDFPQIAKRRDQIVTRMWKGVTSLVKKNDVTWIAGRGRLDGAHKVRVKLAGEDGTPGAGGERILNGTDVILATGSRVKSLPGIVPDGKRIVTSDDILKSESMPASVIVRRRGRGVEFLDATTGAEVTLLQYRPSSRSRTAGRGS